MPYLCFMLGHYFVTYGGDVDVMEDALDIFFFQKEKADLEKLKLILKPEEMSATVNLQTPHERMQHLEQLYQELESHYKKTIERIAAT